MITLAKTGGLLMLPSLLALGWIAACHAAPSGTLDVLPNDLMGYPDKVEVGALKPLAEPKPNISAPATGGNPLWSVPLSALTATQERPIFSASRRPPPRAVSGLRIEPVVATPSPTPAVIESPPLALIGAVVGDRDAIAVFLDRSTQGIVRLRAGEIHQGWLLSSVLGREVTLRKDDQTEVLVLQRADGPPGTPAIPGAPRPMPAIGAVDGSYGPFVPRSTPKNGESDGL